MAIYNLPSLLEIPLLFSQVFLYSDFKFRQVCHWWLKHSVDFKTRFSPVQKHTVPFIPTCPAMFLSFVHVLLNENVTLPFLASL